MVQVLLFNEKLSLQSSSQCTEHHRLMLYNMLRLIFILWDYDWNPDWKRFIVTEKGLWRVWSIFGLWCTHCVFVVFLEMLAWGFPWTCFWTQQDVINETTDQWKALHKITRLSDTCINTPIQTSSWKSSKRNNILN